MIDRQLALILVVATINAGCASAPTEVSKETVVDTASLASLDGDTAPNDGDFLGGAAPEEIVKCRKVESMGSRLKKTVCGPIKDESTLFGIIDSGGTQEPH